MAQQWNTTDIPDLTDKVMVVTGANRGLGLEIVIGLAGANATVVMACRDKAKAQSAVDEIRRHVPGAKLEVMTLDLANLSSVRQFAQDYSARFSRLDLLCNNASAIMVPKQKTRDGFEMHIGTNHLGAFALTGLLMDRLRSTPGARVVNTASMAHRLNKGLDLDDLHLERTPYKEMDAYGRSKLAALLFTFELARRLKKTGIAITAAAAHPGWSNSNPDQGSFLMRFANRLIAQSSAMGALPALHAATAADVSGGDYWGPGGFKELGGYPKKVDCREDARDPALAAKLWALSEQLTGVRYLDA